MSKKQKFNIALISGETEEVEGKLIDFEYQGSRFFIFEPDVNTIRKLISELETGCNVYSLYGTESETIEKLKEYLSKIDFKSALEKKKQHLISQGFKLPLNKIEL